MEETSCFISLEFEDYLGTSKVKKTILQLSYKQRYVDKKNDEIHSQNSELSPSSNHCLTLPWGSSYQVPGRVHLQGRKARSGKKSMIEKSRSISRSSQSQIYFFMQFNDHLLS